MTAVMLVATFLLPAAGEHPLASDRTGIRWALPFQKALARAAKQQRVLMIKPVAFGTSADGGW